MRSKTGVVAGLVQAGGLLRTDPVELVNPAQGSGTGIVFDHYDDNGLRWAMRSALDLYANRKLMQKIVHNGMAQDFSWERQGALYVDLFRKLGARP